MKPYKCHQVLSSESGEFTSPDFPNNYPENVKCSWLINGTNPISISFPTLFLEYDADWIMVGLYRQLKVNCVPFLVCFFVLIKDLWWTNGIIPTYCKEIRGIPLVFRIDRPPDVSYFYIWRIQTWSWSLHSCCSIQRLIFCNGYTFRYFYFVWLFLAFTFLSNQRLNITWTFYLQQCRNQSSESGWITSFDDLHPSNKDNLCWLINTSVPLKLNFESFLIDGYDKLHVCAIQNVYEIVRKN